jgi:hypothetical protein
VVVVDAIEIGSEGTVVRASVSWFRQHGEKIQNGQSVTVADPRNTN